MTDKNLDDICLWFSTGDCISSELHTNPKKDCDGHRKCFAYISKKKHDEEFVRYRTDPKLDEEHHNPIDYQI